MAKINPSLTVLRSANERRMQRQEAQERTKLLPLVDEVAAQVAAKVIEHLTLAGFMPATIGEIEGPEQKPATKAGKKEKTNA